VPLNNCNRIVPEKGTGPTGSLKVMEKREQDHSTVAYYKLNMYSHDLGCQNLTTKSAMYTSDETEDF